MHPDKNKPKNYFISFINRCETCNQIKYNDHIVETYVTQQNKMSSLITGFTNKRSTFGRFIHKINVYRSSKNLNPATVKKKNS